MNDYLNIFLLSLLASILALIGGVVFLFNKKLSEILEINSIPFAAGVLITVSVLGLLPEAYEHLGIFSLPVIFLSIITAYFFEKFVFGLHHHVDGHKNVYKSSVPLVVLGDTIHNFIDGVTIAATYSVSPGLGLITAISTFLHEVPHEIGDFGVLLRAGWKKINVLILNLISASATFVGAFWLLRFSENEVLVGILLSVSAGIFFYLGAIDFLPKVHNDHKNKKVAYISLFMGILIMAIITLLVPHAEVN